MSQNYTENGCLILNWNLAAITKVGASAQQMIPATGPNAPDSATLLTSAGLTATMVTASSKPYFNGQSVAITGANDAAYNGYFQIYNVTAVGGVVTFNYTMASVPTVPAVQSTISFLKFRMALVQADPGNGTAVTIGPAAAGVGRSLIAGQEYQIPQMFGAFGEPVRYEMALWYWVGAAGTKLNIFWI